MSVSVREGGVCVCGRGVCVCDCARGRGVCVCARGRGVCVSLGVSVCLCEREGCVYV